MAVDSSLPGARALGMSDEGYNFLMAVGLLPGLELTGRLATQDLNCNFYLIGSNPCTSPAFRDVSASLKFGHSFVTQGGAKVSAAAGIADFGGAATLNRAYYAVAGWDQASWSWHAGVARAVSRGTPLDGVFAAVAWNPSTAWTLYSEAIGRNAWVGAKAFMPARWAPWPHLRMHMGVHRALTAQTLTAATTFNAGLTLQLGTRQSAQPSQRVTLPSVLHDGARSALTQAQELLALPAQPPQPLNAASRPAAPMVAAVPGQRQESARSEPVRPPTMEVAERWAQALEDAGMEDIHVGATAARHVVRFENTVYRWNDLEALGVALARLVSPQPDAAGAAGPALEVQLTKLGVVTARLAATPTCFRQWLGQAPCPAGEEVQIEVGARHGWRGDADIDWRISGHASSNWRLQVRITPALDYRVGTEYGAVDASAGANLVFQTSPWKGAHLDVAHIFPLYDSEDYRPGGYYADFRLLNRTHRVLMHQALDLGQGITARAAAGRVGAKYDGVMGELRWQSTQGVHRLGYQLARFDPSDGTLGKRTSMVNYRYWVSPLQTALELHAGQFWNTDRGWALGVKHWFEDVNVTTYYRESRFAPEAAFLSPYGSQNVKALGIEFSFPLTPSREWSGHRWRFGFSDRFGLGLETAVRMPDRTNYLIPFHGRFPPVPMSLNGVVYNFDRMSGEYLSANAHLIRKAYWAALSTRAQANNSPR